MKTTFLSTFAIAATLLLSTFTARAEMDPKKHLESVTAKITQDILANKDSIKSSTKFAKGLIEQHLLPEVDTVYMAKRILGKTYWTQATEAQRSLFINEFIGLMLNSYAKGLADYDGQEISYKDTRYSKSGKTASVQSQIKLATDSIVIDYRMKQNTDSKWLITDVLIEGTSMAKSFASQYRDQIADIGLDATLEALKQENAKAAATAEIAEK